MDRAGFVAVARVGAEPVAVVENSATAEKVESVAAGRAEFAVDRAAIGCKSVAVVEFAVDTAAEAETAAAELFEIAGAAGH